jgi:hypothetical protein
MLFVVKSKSLKLIMVISNRRRRGGGGGGGEGGRSRSEREEYSIHFFLRVM